LQYGNFPETVLLLWKIKIANNYKPQLHELNVCCQLVCFMQNRNVYGTTRAVLSSIDYPTYPSHLLWLKNGV